MPAAAPRKYNVILADDDIDDQFLISRAIDETHIDHMLYTVPNGLELINLLQRNAHQPHWPDMIVMDLNMPLLDGFGALKQIRSMESFKSVPLYVLSTSRFEYDRNKARELGATDFFTKPYHFEGLKGIIRDIFTATVNAINSKVP